MAKSKSSKPKFDIKEFMLKKGEYVVLGVAGAGLVLLLFLGSSTYSEAKDPKKISTDLSSKAARIQSAVNDPADPGAVPPLTGPYEIGKPGGYKMIPVSEFPLSGVMFDPTARPDTKRENPRVLGIGDYQVDLVRAPMKAHDIVLDPEGGAKIGVRVTKKTGEKDTKAIRDALAAVKGGAKNAKKAQQAANQPPTGPMGGPAGAPVLGGPMGGPAGPPMLGGPGGPPGEGGPGGFNQGGMRTETTINYIPVEDLDEAAKAGKLPAMTVVPLRMAVINATFPFKKQAEEMRRALRLPKTADPTPFVRFDGFDVRRRVITPDGTIFGTGKKYADVAANPKDDETVGWFDYRYVDKYQEIIASRMLNSHVEGADPKDKSGISAYLPYFYKYEDNLVMFLPELVAELGKYPEVKLPAIVDTVKRMKDAATPQVQKSSVLERLLAGKGKESTSPKTGIFAPTNVAASGGAALYGPQAGMMMPMPGQGEGGKLENGTGNAVAGGVDIDDILVRFIDPDVRPGYSYEYQLRVKLINPNYGNKQSMAIPAMAGEKYKILPGPWTRLTQTLTVPRESHLFAYDPAKYADEVQAAYGKQKSMEDRFKLPAGNTHTVVQKLTWLEQVRVDSSTNQREPVGAWVAAEMPVARGGFIGRKTYVKLPLWSSEETRYQLREIQTEKVGKGKDATTPKGWLVEEFVGRDVLVDFDGGKVTTRVGNKTAIDDVNTELLIVRPDGRLMVRSSKEDMANGERVRDVAEWAKWQSDVENAAPVSGTGGMGQFERPGSGTPVPPGKNN